MIGHKIQLESTVVKTKGHKFVPKTLTVTKESPVSGSFQSILRG